MPFPLFRFGLTMCAGFSKKMNQISHYPETSPPPYPLPLFNFYTENRRVKLYDELPAPDADRFPFKNEMAQWMAEYVFTSRKPEETPE